MRESSTPPEGTTEAHGAALWQSARPGSLRGCSWPDYRLRSGGRTTVGPGSARPARRSSRVPSPSRPRGDLSPAPTATARGRAASPLWRLRRPARRTALRTPRAPRMVGSPRSAARVGRQRGESALASDVLGTPSCVVRVADALDVQRHVAVRRRLDATKSTPCVLSSVMLPASAARAVASACWRSTVTPLAGGSTPPLPPLASRCAEPHT